MVVDVVEVVSTDGVVVVVVSSGWVCVCVYRRRCRRRRRRCRRRCRRCRRRRRFGRPASDAVLLRHALAQRRRELVGEARPALVAHLVLEAVQNLQRKKKQTKQKKVHQ